MASYTEANSGGITPDSGNRTAYAKRPSDYTPASLDAGSRTSYPKKPSDKKPATTSSGQRTGYNKGPIAYQPASTSDSVVVPGDFRRVDVKVEDSNGAPVTDALYVGTTEVFPQFSKVNSNGDAILYMLGTTYTEFSLVLPTDEGVGVQIDGALNNPSLSPLEDSITLQFNVEDAADIGKPVGGLRMADGISLG